MKFGVETAIRFIEFWESNNEHNSDSEVCKNTRGTHNLLKISQINNKDDEIETETSTEFIETMLALSKQETWERPGLELIFMR